MNNIKISKLGNDYIMIDSISNDGERIAYKSKIINIDTMTFVKGDRAVKLRERNDWEVIGRI